MIQLPWCLPFGQCPRKPLLPILLSMRAGSFSPFTVCVVPGALLTIRPSWHGCVFLLVFKTAVSFQHGNVGNYADKRLYDLSTTLIPRMFTVPCIAMWFAQPCSQGRRLMVGREADKWKACKENFQLCTACPGTFHAAGLHEWEESRLTKGEQHFPLGVLKLSLTSPHTPGWCLKC